MAGNSICPNRGLHPLTKTLTRPCNCLQMLVGVGRGVGAACLVRGNAKDGTEVEGLTVWVGFRVRCLGFTPATY